MTQRPAVQPVRTGAATPHAAGRRGVARVLPVAAVRRFALDATLRLPAALGNRAARLLGRLRLVPGIGPRRDAVLALELERAGRALETGDLRAARAHVDVAYRALPAEPRIRALRTEVLEAQGELSELARLQLAVTAADPTHRGAGLALRATLGRLAATDPGWSPRVPGPARPVEPAGDDTVVVLAGSFAAPSAGDDGRAAATVAALEAAGARAVPLPIDVQGIAPGLAYPTDVPVDVLLEHEAWLAARAARAERPAIVHVVAETAALGVPLVAVAVRDHAQRPLVYEAVRVGMPPQPSPDGRREDGKDGEAARRRAALESHLLAAADHVIVGDEAMRDDVVGRGVPAARVSIVPRGADADPETTGRMLRDAHATALAAWASRPGAV